MCHCVLCEEQCKRQCEERLRRLEGLCEERLRVYVGNCAIKEITITTVMV